MHFYVNNTLPLPLIVIFGVDYTLWPFEVGYKDNIWAPFTEKSNGIVDRNGKLVTYYPEVPQIFKEVKELGIKIALTSINTENSAIQQLIFLWGWEEYISYKEMGPDSKMHQIARIHNESNVKYADMLFFDDTYKNIHDVNQLKVLGVLVNEGLNFEVIESGIREFQENKLKSKL